jgi:hypothetical protein
MGTAPWPIAVIGGDDDDRWGCRSGVRVFGLVVVVVPRAVEVEIDVDQVDGPVGGELGQDSDPGDQPPANDQATVLGATGDLLGHGIEVLSNVVDDLEELVDVEVTS